MVCRIHLSQRSPLLVEQVPPLFSFWFDLKNLEMNPVTGVEEMQTTGSKKSTAKKPSEPMFNVQLIYNFYYLP